MCSSSVILAEQFDSAVLADGGRGAFAEGIEQAAGSPGFSGQAGRRASFAGLQP